MMYFTSLIMIETILSLFVIICNFINKLCILSCLTTFFTEWKMLENKDEEYWYGFIPFYNMYKMCEITFGEKNGWYCIFLFLPITNWIMYPIYCNELRKKYGYESLFTIGLILLPFVFLPILAFDEKDCEKKTEDNHISKMAHWNNEEKTKEVLDEDTVHFEDDKNIDDVMDDNSNCKEFINFDERNDNQVEKTIAEKIQEKINLEQNHDDQDESL